MPAVMGHDELRGSALRYKKRFALHVHEIDVEGLLGELFLQGYHLRVNMGSVLVASRALQVAHRAAR